MILIELVRSLLLQISKGKSKGNIEDEQAKEKISFLVDHFSPFLKKLLCFFGN